jgi:tetratricopeptide (TPR) repeat protein
VVPKSRLVWVLALLCSALAPSVAAEGNENQLFERQFQAAVAQYESGHFPEAATQLEKLVRQLPESFEIHELLGMVYCAQSQDAKATAHLQKAVRLRPNSAAARVNLATNLVRLGKLQPAEAEFKKAIQLEPQSYDANHDLGEFYVASGKIPMAVPYLEKAQRIQSTSYNNGYDLSLAYLETGQVAKARQSVRQLLGQKNTAELHNLLGQIEEKDGKFVAAEKEYESAAHMDPSETNLFDWGSELLIHRTLGPAIEVFQHATERYPDSPRLAIGLGISLYSRGNYDEAVKALLRGADLSPSDPRCYLFLSKAYDSSPGQAQEVIERFRRFAELQPQNARAYYYYAMSLWKGRRVEDASLDVHQIEALLKKSIELDPSLAQAYLQLGNLLSDEKQYDAAIPKYERALELNAALTDAHYRLGQAYVRTGQMERAQRQLKVYQQQRAQHLVELDKQRSEIRQFVYSEKTSSGSKQ